ncbi:RTA1 like protein-domain-containing protein [Massariosphaeria phaeospora]|uniref:RTA1 like protein-domain-containing protein n=1 Tax=Massariosphaeria phaeospora TaxID=100035 RepID=A0A7C8M6D8_9PLEO|nr:RTA1 like protein-domain-containing protein [Massariosphaeria phaeospora]
MAKGREEKSFQLYRYDPSIAAAGIFVALFGISTLLHMYQQIRKRAWFLTPFIIGGWFEALGYIGRMMSSKDKDNLSPYIMQSLLLLLAPALFAASIYMILGRIIALTDGEQYSLIRRTWLTKLFVAGDVLSFLMQGGGGGIMSTAKGDLDKLKMGERIILGGLFVQLFFFGFFAVAAAVFQYRGRAHLNSIAHRVAWRKHLYVLYTVSILILIRSLFRVIEYLQGNAGYLLRHEVFLYVFDAVLMSGVMIAMNIVHPGDIAIMLKMKGDQGSSFVELSTSGQSKG